MAPPGRAGRRTAVWLAAAGLLILLCGEAHLGWARRRAETQAAARAGARLELILKRAAALTYAVASAADAAAALPEARSALAGDRAALPLLFRALEKLRAQLPERPALAIEGPPGTLLAWAGPVYDRYLPRGEAPKPHVVVVAGSVSTALAARSPLQLEGGRSAGVATAELPLQARRHIRNAYLSDFDRLSGNEPGIEVRYLDPRASPDGAPDLPGPSSEAPARNAVWRAPDGTPLAALRVLPPPPEEEGRALASRYRRSASALACLAAFFFASAGGGPGSPWLRLTLGASALRLVLLALAPPLPGPQSPLLSPDTYASTLPGPAWLSEPLRSPLDLLLTTAWTLLLALALLRRALGMERKPSHARALLADLAALPLLAALFGSIFDVSMNCSLDLEALSLLPRSGSLLAMHLALVGIVATGGALLAALSAWGGPFPGGTRGLLLRAATWSALGAAAYRFWPRELIGLPLVPAVVLFLLAALLGNLPPAWRRSVGPVGLSLAGAAAAAALVYPSLVHFGEKSTRLQIERDHAPLILRQPRWREYVLAETCRRIDTLELLEEAPPGPHPPPVLEELAFSVWSGTDLAAFGFSSAVELQDASGRLISRFALNLPALGAPPPLPESPAWTSGAERLALGSAERPVLHARRQLVYHGELHGAIHVYVGDDFWDLPFLTDRDPYSVLFRSAAAPGVRSRPLGLLVYDRQRGLVFSSSERPPALGPDLVARLLDTPTGRLWTTLAVDGRPAHTFLFHDANHFYGITYPRLEAGRFGADLLEAVAGIGVVVLAGLLLVMALRDLLGRPTLSLLGLVRQVGRRFSLRVFVAFVAVAVLPVIVLQFVVREFVTDRLRRESERQALELAAIARKAVEDFALLQRREPEGARPVTDDALVYIASLLRNDLDVFEGGRLLASSKRELYASGLLPSRVSAEVFRSLVLEGQPTTLRTETIGGFSYLAASVPVRLDASEPGLLSMPLALRQREVEAVLGDLYRTIRLASALFLAAAALLAQSMARRISGPIRELTRATRRIASGDLEARVAPVSRDELRDLMESFNQMASDLDRQRRDLERSNRLAAWAEMARQVAHEVKNPLTPIQLSAEHLRRVFRDRGADFEATLERCTETILSQVASLRRIVTEFSAFARPPAAVLQPHDMSALIEDVLSPYLRALPPDVNLALQLAPGTPRVRGDRRLLERAVLNLLENALQAVGERGEIAVSLGSRNGRVEVVVEDDGPGLDPEIRDRVFEPFFSTKIGGSGLGLALVKKIAEDHGGGVTLTSAAGERTRALLWLPAEEEATG